MIEAILLLGLVGLFAAYRSLSKRLDALEQRIAQSARVPHQAAAEPAAAGAPVPAPAAAFSEVEMAAVAEAFAETRLPDHGQASGEPEPLPAPPAGPASESLAALFERFVGGRLLVWTGGIALGLAGLFLVRYSIEVGLIGPTARMVIAAVFGFALLGAGEYARRRLPGDPRIGQALVGAGVLVLYAAAYGSHILYGLIGLGTAFVLMAAVAGAALVLSLRHGTPTAALGLVGGFLTPLLVGNSEAGPLPLLGYLALLNIAIFAVARRTGQGWLAGAAQLLTLLWTASLLFPLRGDVLAVGLFLLVYTLASSLVPPAGKERFPGAASGFALVQLGLIVAIGDYAWPGWAWFLALAAAAFALGERSRGLAHLPARALAAALLLLASQAGLRDAGAPVGAVAALVTLLFAGGAWWRLGTSGPAFRWPWLFCAAVAGPALLLRVLDAPLLSRPGWGLLFAGLSLAPAALAWRLRGAARTEPPFDSSLLLAGATTALLLGAGTLDLTAASWLPLAWMLVALAVLAGARRIGDGGIVRLAVVCAAAGSLAAAIRAPDLWATLAEALAGAPALLGGLPPPGTAVVLFAAPALVWLALRRAMPSHEPELIRIAGWAAALLAGLFAYLAFKQIFALRTPADFIARGLAERTLLTQGLFFGGWMLLKRPRLAWLEGAASALTAVAAARFLWFDVLVLNPAAVAQSVGALPALNLLAPAYLGSAFWLYEARRRSAGTAGERVFLGLFLLALVAGAGLLVRQIFHGAILTGGDMPRAEFYGYSLAGLVLSVGLLVAGWRRRDTPLRVAGLALLTATVVKVFLVDAAALEGLLRILSFLGLGIALIGMGKLYGTVLGRGASTSGDPKPATGSSG